MRITKVIGGLGGGGAERVCINLANAWVERGREVTILTISEQKAPPAYPLDRRVQTQNLGPVFAGNQKRLDHDTVSLILRGLYGIGCHEMVWDLPLLVKLRGVIIAGSPDVVIAHMSYTNVRVLAALHETGIPVVACEHTDISQFKITPWHYTREAVYRRAHAVVAPHPAIANWLHARGAKAYAIPNPLHAPQPVYEGRDGERRRLVTLSRLAAEKRIHLIVRAFAEIAERFPEWDLDIYGEGPLREEIAKLIDELAPGRVHLRGFTSEPYDVLRSCDLFVSASWLEGFGNSIWEALASGVPVVALECGAPVRSLVRDGIDGLIVNGDNPRRLAAAMASLMGNEPARSALSSRCREVVTRFSRETALERWDALFEEVLARTRSAATRSVPGAIATG